MKHDPDGHELRGIELMTNQTIISGVSGVMEAYKTSLLHVGLSGPTNCAPMMRLVSKLAITAAQSRTAHVSVDLKLAFL